MKKSIRNQNHKKYRSRRKLNTRNKQYHMVGSSVLSSGCKEKIKDIFKKYINPSHKFALKAIYRQLLQKHPISIIKFIETHFNKSVILNKFNNDNCLNIFLNIIQNDFNTYRNKMIQDDSYAAIPVLTMNELVNIIDIGIQKKNYSEGNRNIQMKKKINLYVELKIKVRKRRLYKIAFIK